MRALPGKRFCFVWFDTTQACLLPLNNFKDQLRSTALLNFRFLFFPVFPCFPWIDYCVSSLCASV